VSIHPGFDLRASCGVRSEHIVAPGQKIVAGYAVPGGEVGALIQRFFQRRSRRHGYPKLGGEPGKPIPLLDP
jgi:hypothetical protein